MIPFLRIIFVVCIFHAGDRIRIISARKAERKEEELYYEKHDVR